MKWFSQDSTELIGLDIDSAYIKLLEIVPNSKSLLIKNFAIQPSPDNAIVKDEIKDINAIANSLKIIFKKADIQNKNIALAIPRSTAIIKTTIVDKRLTSSEIESRAWIEANRLFPELVGEIYLDYQLTTPTAEDPNKIEMMLVACRKEKINPYLEILHAANLVEKIIDLDVYALERALTQMMLQFPEVQTAALLNLNVANSSLIVVQEKELIYTHDHSFDGQRLMTQSQQFSDKTIEDPAYLDFLRENLISHLRHSMHFFYSSKPNVAIQKLALSGDCALVPHLASFIQQEIGIETILADPFAKMDVSQGINHDELKRYTPVLMLCCGLALTKIGS